MKSHTVTGGGETKLHVQETGNAAGKPILFIHGISQCGTVWRRQLESELAEEFRLVAMDLRGHGFSEKRRDVYGDSKIWADDVQAVIDELGLESPVIVAWSYGGAVLSDYLDQYGDEYVAATNWVGALTRLGNELVEPGYLGQGFIDAMPGFFSEDREDSVTALQELIRLCMHDSVSAEEWYLLLGINMAVPPHVREGLLSRELNNDAAVERLRGPALVTHGDEDQIILAGMRDRIAGLAPDARLSTYPGTGHAPFWEASARFNEELGDLRRSV